MPATCPHSGETVSHIPAAELRFRCGCVESKQGELTRSGNCVALVEGREARWAHGTPYIPVGYRRKAISRT